jgi:curli biogenesis system outer membrane secretion channel CsgG
MKTLFTALVLGIMAAAVSSAEAQTRPAVRGVKTAVVEFTPVPNVSAMTDNAKRLLHTGLSASLMKTRKFDVYDTRHTHNATKGDLTAINGSSTAAALKAAKQLGVAYILTGTVTEYKPKLADEHGSAEVSVRLIEVATGKVVYKGEVSVKSGGKMRTGSDVEMQAYVMKHIIDQVTEVLVPYV